MTERLMDNTNSDMLSQSGLMLGQSGELSDTLQCVHTNLDEIISLTSSDELEIRDVKQVLIERQQ